MAKEPFVAIENISVPLSVNADLAPLAKSTEKVIVRIIDKFSVGLNDLIAHPLQTVIGSAAKNVKSRIDGNTALVRLRAASAQRQIKNTIAAIEGAAKHGFTSDHADHLNADWLDAWLDGASRVSSDDLRELWARLLANAGTSKSGCSMRTLALVRSLGQPEAALFSQLSNIVWTRDGWPFVPVIGSSIGYITLEHFDYEATGLTYATFLMLDEIGLIDFREGISTPIIPGSKLRCGSTTLAVQLPRPDDSVVHVPQLRLTVPGAELFAVCEPSPFPEYIKECTLEFARWGVKLA